MPAPGVRVTVAEPLSRDHVMVCEWCDLWGKKLNESKTKTMVVSRSGKMHPQSTALDPSQPSLPDRVAVVPVFQLAVCSCVTMHIVYLWQYNVSWTRSGVT